MTSIERTAYPGFSRAPQLKELIDLYTPVPADVAFVSTTARGPNQKFALMILLKVFQKLGYFPAPQQIPGAIIGHIRGEMKLPEDLVPDITPRTLYKYHAAIRSHLKINGDSKQIRHIALKAVSEVILVKDDPADLINVAIETLVKESCELPAFSTLDILVRRLRNFAHQRIFQTVQTLLSEAEQTLLVKLVETNPTGYFSEFNRLREAPKSATLTSLEDWTKRLTWLLSLGNMERLITDLPAAKVTHFAAEARSLHADDLRDFTLPSDLCVRGSELFDDYRDQLLSWEECEPKVAEYCQQLGFATDAEGFVEGLKRWLTEVSLEVDRTRPDNHELVLTSKGEPVLRKPTHKTPPKGLAKLEATVAERMPEAHVLDILCRIDYWTKWTRHLGPLSGADPKMEDARARQILTSFAYASHLGPYQLARHFPGEITGDMLAMINRRHVTTEKLDACIRDIINRFNSCPLPRCWGTGKRVAADGTQYDLAEENLLAEKHIRYGGFGGIAYHHVSDMYILLFSHFISCGVWESVHIVDALMKNQSDIQPDTIHADTQGQNLPVFALSHLLGIKLMPRIRNWKDLKLYRPSKDIRTTISTLFFAKRLSTGISSKRTGKICCGSSSRLKRARCYLQCCCAN